MKSDYNQMSDQQLRDYIKQHRTDDEAITELFVNRRSNNAPLYNTSSIQEAEEIIRQKISKSEGS